MFYDNLKAVCDIQKVKLTPLIKECGGSTGAIGNWKKGAFPNSDIVMKLARRLNVTTDFLLFGAEDSDMSAEEQRLTAAYRKLNGEGQRAVLSQAEAFAEMPQYQKYTDTSKEA